MGGGRKAPETEKIKFFKNLLKKKSIQKGPINVSQLLGGKNSLWRGLGKLRGKKTRERVPPFLSGESGDRAHAGEGYVFARLKESEGKKTKKTGPGSPPTSQGPPGRKSREKLRKGPQETPQERGGASGCSCERGLRRSRGGENLHPQGSFYKGPPPL